MKTHTGFTLIEVLIAMLVLAIGLMGLATLQTYSLRANLSAYTRGQATQLLYDMSDKMRANSSLAKTTTASYIISNTTTDLRTKGKTVNSTHDCRKIPPANSNPCTTAKLADYDLIEWHNAIIGTLPMGRACITNTNNIYTLYIAWDDNHSGAVYSDQTNIPNTCVGLVSNVSTNENDQKNPDPVLSISVQL